MIERQLRDPARIVSLALLSLPAFEPVAITADGKALPRRPDLESNGFAVQKLAP